MRGLVIVVYPARNHRELKGGAFMIIGKCLNMVAGRCFLSLILFLQPLTVAHAAVVFSNLDAGGGFEATGATFGFNGSQLAYSFTVEPAVTPFYLDSINVALRGDSNGTGISVNFATNVTGGLEPDTILETANVFLFGNPVLTNATFSGTTLVDTPGTYWVWLTCTSGCFTNSIWFDNSIGALGDKAEKPTPSSAWNVTSSVTQGAFRINGTVVPIPAAVWLFASGLIGLIGFARNRKQFQKDLNQ